MNIRRGDTVRVNPACDDPTDYIEPNTVGVVVKTRYNPWGNYHIMVKFSRNNIWGRFAFPCFLNEIKVIRRNR